MKRSQLLTIAAILIISGGIFLLTRRPSSPSPTSFPTSYEYFFSPTCPHCAVVDDFLESWEDKDKIKIEKKEVLNNQVNITLFYQRGAYCDIPKNELGVPFLFTPDGKCIVGDTPIIDFFKNLSL